MRRKKTGWCANSPRMEVSFQSVFPQKFFPGIRPGMSVFGWKLCFHSSFQRQVWSYSTLRGRHWHAEKEKMTDNELKFIPLHELPRLIPSSRRGKRLALATIYRWAASGRLKTSKIGGGRYVSHDDLLEFLHGPTSAESCGGRNQSRAKKAGDDLTRLGV